MIPAKIPENEEARLKALRGLTALSGPRDADLDRITETAKLVFGTDMALVTLVDEHRQWFLSRQGLELPETAREDSLCAHAINEEEMLIIHDLRNDDRFSDSIWAGDEFGVRFYAGRPIRTDSGLAIGTFCVIDTKPRQMSREERRILANLGRMVAVVLSHRQLGDSQQYLMDSLAAAERDMLLDPLTGVWNRRGFEQLLEKELARASRDKTPLGLAFLDIDHFKDFNDQHGHVTGDKVLQCLAGILTATVRKSDIVARYGGEEFVIIAPGLSEQDLEAYGRKLCAAIGEDGELEGPTGPLSFTASIGLTSLIPAGSDKAVLHKLVEAADAAMYRAKEAGRQGYSL